MYLYAIYRTEGGMRVEVARVRAASNYSARFKHARYMKRHKIERLADDYTARRIKEVKK